MPWLVGDYVLNRSNGLQYMSRLMKQEGRLDARDRYRGCLLGLAAGDALGTRLEFQQPGTFIPIDDLLGEGPFHLEPGQWTDDTSMALCLAESLIACQAFDAQDQMTRYLRWYREGYWSSTGECFDIGNTVRAALELFERTGNPFAGSTDPRTAGNGSLMRLAPVVLACGQEPDVAIAWAAESSRTTHGARAAQDACRYFGGLLLGTLGGASKDELLAGRYEPIPGIWEVQPLVSEIDEIARGSFRIRQPPEIRGTGYVVRSLEAALWAFQHAENFRHGCLLAANLGDDADTTAAIYGQIAGAYFGLEGIPQEWAVRIAFQKEILRLADQLYVLAGWEA
jgi:ADP-ribosyl-[dinitrogen reductase] hydrolase